MLRDTLTNIKGESNEALYQHAAMNEALNMQLENGYHMKHNGDRVYHVGGDKYIHVQGMKRKR